MLIGKKQSSGLPCGVYKGRKNNYITHISVGDGKVTAIKHSDPLSANKTYKVEKLRRIKECFEKCKHTLSSKVRDALDNYNLDERLAYN